MLLLCEINIFSKSIYCSLTFNSAFWRAKVLNFDKKVGLSILFKLRIKIIYFSYLYSVASATFIEKSFFNILNGFGSYTENQLPEYIMGPFLSSIMFHWSVCLSLQ